jgi:hypothetical protein
VPTAESREEYLEYECAGSYRLPPNPDEVCSTDWRGWDDWLGIPWRDYETARRFVQQRLPQVRTKEEYLQLFQKRQNWVMMTTMTMMMQLVVSPVDPISNATTSGRVGKHFLERTTFVVVM